MHPSHRRRGLLPRCAALGVALVTAGAAPTAVATLDVDLDGDGQPEQVRFEGGLLTVKASSATGGRSIGEVRAPSPAGTPGAGALRAVDVGNLKVVHAIADLRTPPGAPGAKASAAAGGARRVELVVALEGEKDAARLRTLFAGVTGPQGNDAEWALHLRVDAGGVLRYQTAPEVRRCDGDALLFPELYDVASGRFRAVSMATPDGAPLVATRVLPPEAERPPLGLFHHVAASSMRGDGGRADVLRPPRALDDGRPETTWYEGMAGWGRGAWVTARSSAPGQIVTGLKLVRAPGNLLREVTLFVGAKERYRARLPERSGRGDGPIWIGLPAPVAADCVSLAIADAETGGRNETGLADVSIYTRLDGPEGLAALVRAIADGAPGADGLAALLVAKGPAALPAIRAELAARGVPVPGSSATEAAQVARADGARRLLRVLLDGETVESVPLLIDGMRSGGAEARRLIVDALVRAGDQAGAAANPRVEEARKLLLASLGSSHVPTAAKLDAIRILVGWRRPELVRRLVEMELGGELGDGAEVRDAVVRAAPGGAAEELVPLVAAAVERDVAAAPTKSRGEHVDDELRILAALGARARAAGQTSMVETVAGALRAAWRSATADFGVRFRVLRALRDLRATSLLPLLEEALAPGPGSDEALRWAAVEAAASVDGEAGAPLVARAVTDPDPRVRTAALAGLGSLRSPALPAAAASALDGDRWPMVRRTAAERLAGGCPGEGAPALERAAVSGTSDEDVEVRRMALASLGQCDSRRAARVAVALVAAPRVPAPVRELAATLAATLKAPDAAPAIARALETLLADPRADERTAYLGVSLARALGRLADGRGEEALLEAATQPPSPAIRAAAIAALASLCTSKAKQALAAAARDPDAAVRSAAAAARCRP